MFLVSCLIVRAPITCHANVSIAMSGRATLSMIKTDRGVWVIKDITPSLTHVAVNVGGFACWHTNNATTPTSRVRPIQCDEVTVTLDVGLYQQ